MSTFERKPEVVTSAAYHADTDDEDFDVKTSAVMDYDVDTDDEGFTSSSAAPVDKGVNKFGFNGLDVCQEVDASNPCLPSRKRKQTSPEKEEDCPPERAGRKRRKKYECSSHGCSNYAVKGGVCIRHGASQKRCSSEGCTNQARKGGVCIRHGAKIKAPKRCSSEGCTNQALKGGVCCRHGAYPIPYAR